MSRSVKEWEGRSDDAKAPPRVRLRVFQRCKGRCGICDRAIRPGETWTLEHVVALINGGANAEANLGVTCKNCLAGKNAADVAEKSHVAKLAKGHHSIKKSGRGFFKPVPKPTTPLSKCHGCGEYLDGCNCKRVA